MEYLFLAFHAFPGFLGWYPMLSKKPRNPGKLGTIPGFPRFFAHFCTHHFAKKAWSISSWLSRLFGKPGRCGVSWLSTFSRISWKAWKAKSLRAFLESQESPGLPGFSFCAKKRGKPGIYPPNSGDFLALFCRGIKVNRVYLRIHRNVGQSTYKSSSRNKTGPPISVLCMAGHQKQAQG